MAGGVVHFEIPADDEDRARDFYSSAFGWEMNPLPDMSYTLITTTPVDATGRPSGAGSINGGMFRREGEMAAPVVTVDVEDIDAALEKIAAIGGSVFRGKMEVPGMGWNAYFKDSEGNIVGLWQNSEPGFAPGPDAAANDIGA
ncbi:VOC family protein [Arthrobacter sp. NPDC058288]|uniref:VOC family protein n=1 Tax=Arthrobacter sp. NPDC058288 TaxID=3346424 RepID=UPI0036EBC1B0